MNSLLSSKEVVPKASVFLLVLGATATDLNIPHVAGVKSGMLILMLCLSLAILFYLQANSFRFPKPVIGPSSRIYLAYLALILVSALWAPSATTAIIQFIVFAMIWSCAVLFSGAPPSLFVRYIVYIAIITSVLSIIVAPLSHSYAFQPVTSGDRPELRGVFYHQLRLGQYAGLALALIMLAVLNGHLGKIFGRPTLAIMALPILALATFLAYARLYTFFTLMGLVLTYFFSKGKPARILSTIGIVIAVALAIFFQGTLEAELAGAGVDTTLTGRVRLWGVTIEEALNRPWLGHGYNSFDSPSYDWMWNLYRPAHPHNSYIQAFFENGYIGLILIVMLSIVHFATASRPDRHEGRHSYTFLIITLLILGSLTGANYASSVTSIFCFALWLITSKEARAARMPSTRGTA